MSTTQNIELSYQTPVAAFAGAKARIATLILWVVFSTIAGLGLPLVVLTFVPSFGIQQDYFPFADIFLVFLAVLGASTALISSILARNYQHFHTLCIYLGAVALFALGLCGCWNADTGRFNTYVRQSFSEYLLVWSAWGAFTLAAGICGKVSCRLHHNHLWKAARFSDPNGVIEEGSRGGTLCHVIGAIVTSVFGAIVALTFVFNSKLDDQFFAPFYIVTAGLLGGVGVWSIFFFAFRMSRR